MRTACCGGNQVDVTLAHRLTVFGKCHGPFGALAFGKAVVVAVRITFTFKQGDHGIPVEGLHQVVAQASFVEPVLGVFGFLVVEPNANARHQHRFAAQQVHQLVHRQVGGFEVFAIGPNAHGCALFTIIRVLLADFEFFNHVAASKYQMGDLAFAVGGDFHAFGQRIGHADAHAVQSTGEAVGAALAFVELTASVQSGENDLNDGYFFLWVHAKGNATAVVFDADRAVRVQGDGDFFAVAGQRLVGGVV